MNRREFMRALGAGTITLGTGRVWADAVYRGSKIIQAEPIDRGGPVVIEDGKIIQPRREIPLMCDTNVLVVGGGCAGVIAALSAARTGASVTLVERYGCFGGLWTAGQVLIVLATHAKQKTGLTKCIRGIGDELLERLTQIKYGIVNQAPGKRDPTSDPEATKYIMAKMLREAKVNILLHGWATNAIMDGNTAKGVIFESKSGCHAVTAKVVVDATGDGDIYGAAGAAHVRHIHRIGLVHRRGNTDRIRQEGNPGKSRRVGAVTPIPSVKWVNMQGPAGDCLDIKTLTQCDLDGREAIWRNLKTLQEKPGHEQIFLVDTASQLGVRASRTLTGLHELKLQDAKEGKAYPDVVAVGGGYAFIGEVPCQIPYGCLVPQKVDGLLTAGRCVAADNMMLNYTRLIGPCLVTGHAAGAAAGLAVDAKCQPRNVDVRKLQDLLTQQGAYLG